MIDLRDKSYRTSELKSISEKLVQGENVNKNAIVGILIYVPVIVTSLILSTIFLGTGLLGQGTIYQTIIEIVMTACLSLFFVQIGNIVKNGVGRVSFAINIKLFLLMFIIAEVELIVRALFVHGQLASFIMFIVSIIISAIIFPVYYLIINRDYSIEKAIIVGIPLGIKYFFRIIWLWITFIPWMILIGITFGIVGIFKLTYIQTTMFLLLEKILQENNL